MERKPATERYDAVVDLFPSEDIPLFAYALIKFTYAIQDGALRLIKPEPLFHDLRDKDLSPRILPGSDFWVTKTFTDVAVRGSAFAPGGKPVSYSRVGITVGGRSTGTRGSHPP